MKRLGLVLLVGACCVAGREVKTQEEVLNDTVEPKGFIDRGGYIEPPMARIRAGNFIMGSPNEADEQPLTEIRIGYDLEVGRYEVTFDEYDRYCTARGIECPEDNGWGRGKRPVVNVSWHDAEGYAKWLSEQSGQHYRLPSEAEWEYAARAGSKTPFCFGKEVSGLDQYAWHEFNAGNVTHTVGQKKPNRWGLYDVHGNVWEWCADGYQPGYAQMPHDGSPSSEGVKKVLRGGGYASYDEHMRTAKRFKLLPFLKSKKNGFRLVREIP